MGNIAISLGNLMAKAGITTKRSSMRLAEETGKAMVDKFKTLECLPEQADIVEIFEQTLPKRLRPKIITELDDVIPYQAKSLNISEEEAKKIVYGSNLGACSVPNGIKRGPIYLPIKDCGKNVPAIFAHELEHNLEQCNLIDRLKRLLSHPISKIFPKSKKRFLESVLPKWQQCENDIINYPVKQNLAADLDSSFNIAPTKEDIYGLLNRSPEGLEADLAKRLRQYADCETKDKFNKNIYKIFKLMLDPEIRAYTVGGRVHQYATGEGTTSLQTVRSVLYNDMKKVIKKDKKQYIRNLLRGNLKSGYRSDADLLALAKNEEEKKFLEERIPKLNDKVKLELFSYSKIQPSCIENMMKNAKSTEFKSISKMNNPDGTPVFDKMTQGFLLFASPDKVKEFAKIAGEKTSDGLYKYQSAAIAINHPRFDLIKKIADIEVNGTNPYAQFSGNLFMMTSEELEKLYTVLKSAEPSKETMEALIKQINNSILRATKTEQLEVVLGV